MRQWITAGLGTLGVLVAIGLGAGLNVLWTNHAAKQIGRETGADIRSDGEAYPFMYVDKADLAEGKDKLRLWLGSAKGATYYVAIWVSPAEANRDAKDERYWSMRKYQSGHQIIYDGSTATDHDIPPGDYFIEMSARNGTVVERLTVGEGVQSIKLVRAGAELPVPQF